LESAFQGAEYSRGPRGRGRRGRYLWGPEPGHARMNFRTALLAAILTLGLAMAAWFLLAPPKTGSSGQTATLPEWLQRLEHSPVMGISVKSAGGVALAVEAIPTEWALPPGFLLREPGQPAWPVDDARVRSATRLLREAVRDAKPVASSGFAPGTVATWSAAPASGRVVFSERSTWLGGQALVQVEGGEGTLRISADVARLFEPESLRAWRNPGVFAGASVADGAEVKLESIRGTVLLKKSSGRWGLPEARIPADPDRVAPLLRSCAALSASRLIGPPDSDVAAKTTPTLIATVRSTLTRANASGEVERSSLVQELRVLGAGDASGASLMAVATVRREGDDTPLWGPMAMLVAPGDLTPLEIDAGTVALRTALELPAAELTRFAFGRIPTGEDMIDAAAMTPPDGATIAKGEHPSCRVTLSRDLDSWTLKGPLASGPRDATTIQRLLALLCTTPASTISLGSAEGVKAWLTIVPVTPRGPHCVLAAGTGTGPGGKRVLVLRRGGAWYVYAPEVSEPVISLLEALVPEEG